MCILSFIPAKVEVNEEDLLNGGIANPDGSGWAIAAHDRIIHGKDMRVEVALDAFMAAREQHPNSPALFHSRWATDGSYGIVNVHPFFMGGSEKTIMAHNGILKCRPGPKDWRSDTRIFADELLSTKYRRLDKPKAFEAMETYCGTNKLVILTIDRRYRRNAYIVNEHLGHWDETTGVWHSNYDYMGMPKYSAKPYKYRYQKNSKGVWESGKVSCYYCGGGYVDTSGYCDECGTCELCFEFREDCKCNDPYTHWSDSVRKFDWQTATIGKSAKDSSVVFSAGNNVNADIVDQIDEIEREGDNLMG